MLIPIRSDELNISIVVEYFENYHTDTFNWSEEKFRLFNIIQSNDEVKFAMVFRESEVFYDKNFMKPLQKQCQFLLDRIINEFYLENEKVYIITKLIEITKNQEISEMIYNSEINSELYMTEVEDINQLFIWIDNKYQNKIWQEFMKKNSTPKIITNDTIEDLDISDLDSENDSDSDNESLDSEPPLEPDPLPKEHLVNDLAD